MKDDKVIKHDDDDDDDDDQEEEEVIKQRLPVDRDWISKLLRKYPNPYSRRNDKALVVAPMVDQSDLPFRMLCRKYGANLSFTPMIHSKLLVTSAMYRKKFLMSMSSYGNKNDQSKNENKKKDDDDDDDDYDETKDGTENNNEKVNVNNDDDDDDDDDDVILLDRPVIAQLCGSDPDIVLQAAKLIEPYVDGIDINCGCPQGIARRGNYGAFLLEQEETLLTLVKHLVKYLSIPLSVKVRLLPSNYNEVCSATTTYKSAIEDSLELYSKLVDAGIHLLTIHGRNRHQKGIGTGHADWETIRVAVERFGSRIPIFANGSIQHYNDVEECLQVTNADGIMSSESLLEYPPIFYHQPQIPTRTVGRLQLAKEYIRYAIKFPPNVGGQGSGLKCIRIHIHRFLHADLQIHPTLRKQVINVHSVDELLDALNECQKLHDDANHIVSNETLSWYVRHRTEYERHNNSNSSDTSNKKIKLTTTGETKDDDDDDDDEDEEPDEDEINQGGALSLFGTTTDPNGNDDDGDY